MELLSPAGSYESLKAAVFSGADAVYIGGVRFSARRNAKNFSDNEIIEAINICHLYGVKLYVALNILIKETEFSDAVNYAKFLIESGVDGIIVQDLGLISAIRKLSDEIFINASTQMTIASTEGVNVAKKLGANRVVLARELGIEKNVNFCGNVNDLAARYHNYAVFILPSYYEGLPLVLLEAQAAGLPIVSFDCPTGPAEIVTDGVNGYLIPTYDTDAMARRINTLIENDETRLSFSKKSGISIDKFSKERVLALWHELIEGVR